MKLVYFSWIRERLNMAEETVDLPDAIATTGDLIEWQRNRGEPFASVFEQDKVVRVALDQEHADDPDASIADVREIAFFPPMTGG